MSPPSPSGCGNAPTLERPIYRLRPDGRAEIIDGWHRLQVAKERGEAEVEALVGRYPDAPRFSRTLGEAVQGGLNSVRDYQLAAGYTVGDYFRAEQPGKLHWWHKTVGTQFNLAQRNPLFRRVFEAAQSFLNDVSFFANDAADKAQAILPRLDGISDVWKTPMSTENNQALAAPLFRGHSGVGPP